MHTLGSGRFQEPSYIGKNTYKMHTLAFIKCIHWALEAFESPHIYVRIRIKCVHWLLEAFKSPIDAFKGPHIYAKTREYT